MVASYNIRYEKPPSAAVLAARARRLARASDNIARTEWFISEVLDKLKTTLRHRVKIATELVRSKVTLNISRPVTKTYRTTITEYIDENGKKRRIRKSTVEISDRSKKGEFPKADTVLLLKTIFGEVVQLGTGSFAGYVGTPLMYGLTLELKMERSFLVRTLNEERTKVMRILTGPI